MKTIKIITATLTALTLCLAIGCGNTDQVPPDKLVDLNTHTVVACYDRTRNVYVFANYGNVAVPAGIVTAILNGEVDADWGDLSNEPEGLADEEQPGTRQLPEDRHLEQAAAE